MEHREHGAGKSSGRGWIEAVMRAAAEMKKAPAGRGCPARAGRRVRTMDNRDMTERNKKVNRSAKKYGWFRAYRDDMHRPVLMRQITGDEFRFWYSLCCLADRESGKLPTIDDIEFHARVPLASVEQMLERLTEVGLVTLVGDDSDTQHYLTDWQQRQYTGEHAPKTTSAQRMRKSRQLRREATMEDA